MDITTTSTIERLARVLAGQRLSSNAAGSEDHAATQVDATWPDHCDHAVAILRTLREPDEEMERAGDIAVWRRMIAAALGEHAAGATMTSELPDRVRERT